MNDAIARALRLGPESSASERTIDISTRGARTGRRRRTEVWFHHIDGRWFISGVPGPRDWYANVLADPRFVVHLKNGVTADLPATAVLVDGPTRHRVITAILELQNRPQLAGRAPAQDFDAWLARSPLIEIVFDHLQGEQ